MIVNMRYFSNLLKDSLPTWNYHHLHPFEIIYERFCGNCSAKETIKPEDEVFQTLFNISIFSFFFIIINKIVDNRDVTDGEWCWQHCYLYASDNIDWKLEFCPLSGHFLRLIYSIQSTIFLIILFYK